MVKYRQFAIQILRHELAREHRIAAQAKRLGYFNIYKAAQRRAEEISKILNRMV